MLNRYFIIQDLNRQGKFHLDMYMWGCINVGKSFGFKVYTFLKYLLHSEESPWSKIMSSKSLTFKFIKCMTQFGCHPRLQLGKGKPCRVCLSKIHSIIMALLPTKFALELAYLLDVKCQLSILSTANVSLSNIRYQPFSW